MRPLSGTQRQLRLTLAFYMSRSQIKVTTEDLLDNATVRQAVSVADSGGRESNFGCRLVVWRQGARCYRSRPPCHLV